MPTRLYALPNLLTYGRIAAVPVVVALNRYVATDDLHVRNRLWLSERYGYDVVTDPAARNARAAGLLMPNASRPATSGTAATGLA